MNFVARLMVLALLVAICNGLNMYNVDSAGPRNNDTVGNNINT